MNSHFKKTRRFIQPKDAFKTEAEFGKQSIMSLGQLRFSCYHWLAMLCYYGHDAYIKIDAATTSDLINAIIEPYYWVVEPTKIPLAEGVYKTRLPVGVY